MANIWFVRSNGDTVHNDPSTPDYVPDEPPEFPKVECNYRLKCLKQGFARIGWPNTGDLTLETPVRLAPNGYSIHNLESRYLGYLYSFSGILAGDLILIPADQDRGDVHLGIALTVKGEKIPPYINPRPKAYYYYHNISKGDWYECAHRVNVLWACTNQDDYSIFHVKAVEDIIWIYAFSQVIDTNGAIYQMAQKAKLF